MTHDNPFATAIERMLGDDSDVRLSFAATDQTGCAWKVTTDTDEREDTVEAPFGTDDWDVAYKVRHALNELHLYGHITHPEDGRIDVLAVR